MNSIIEIASEITSILDLSDKVNLTKEQILTQQYARAEYFYLVIEGEVEFSLNLEGESQELLVGKSNDKLTPVGWSGFNLPHRYTTTVKVSSEKLTAYRWNHKLLKDCLRVHPEESEHFLKLISAKSRNLIREAIHLLGEYEPALPQQEIPILHEEYQSVNIAQEEDLVQFLRRSPFFEIFEEKPLNYLSQHIERRQYRTNDIVYEQGSQADGIYILAIGKIRFSYHDENQQYISFRQISTPGFIVGWSGAIDLPNLINANAVQESVIYFIPKDCLESLLLKYPNFAPKLYYRLLWLLSHQLQAVRARLISAKFNHEIVAISNLIEQNSTRLELTSALHKVPHLLENKLTVKDGIETLKWLKEVGTTLEKNISALSLDILQEICKEQQFFTGLINVYDTVIKAPAKMPSKEVRSLCAESYADLFKDIPYSIEGLQNLPDEPGNIFIYNHLRNHPFNTLPNQFQLTLDSHFISSLILNKKYDDPGIRIVRIGRGAEYAHQEYYQRLGHIDVYTNESDPSTHSTAYREEQRQLFYERAGTILSSGKNLIISPEGTSYATDESPGPFKPGAFRLALGLKEEPKIVPIALANFDKRIRNNRFSCIILPAFRVSDYLSKSHDKKALKCFLKDYQKEFGEYVQQAIALGAGKIK